MGRTMPKKRRRIVVADLGADRKGWHTYKVVRLVNMRGPRIGTVMNEDWLEKFLACDETTLVIEALGYSEGDK